jgi:hypothetical protein
VLEQMRAESNELRRERLCRRVNEIGGASGCAVLGKDARDAPGGHFLASEEPWQRADADTRSNCFAQEEEVVAGGTSVHGDLFGTLWPNQRERIGAGIEDDIVVARQVVELLR